MDPNGVRYRDMPPPKPNRAAEILAKCTDAEDFIKHIGPTRSEGKIRIEEAHINGKTFDKYDFEGMLFVNCEFTNCYFIKTKAVSSTFHICKFNNVKFSECIIESCFEHSDFNGNEKEIAIEGGSLIFKMGSQHCTLVNTVIKKCTFRINTSADFVIESAKFLSVNISFDNTATRIVFNNSKFERGTINGHIRDSDFVKCSMSNIEWDKFIPKGSVFEGCDLSGVEFTSESDMSHSYYPGTIIRKVQLLSIKDERRPTIGRQSEMVIVHPVDTLRLEFGGFWGLVHSLMLVVFLAPYAILTIKLLLLMTYSPLNGSGVLNVSVYWNYFLTGGSFNGIDPLYIFTFSLLAVYNFFYRLPLLILTLELDRRESVMGVPLPYQLSDTTEIFNKKIKYFSAERLLRFKSAFVVIALLAVIHQVYKFMFLPAPFGY